MGILVSLSLVWRRFHFMSFVKRTNLDFKSALTSCLGDFGNCTAICSDFIGTIISCQWMMFLMYWYLPWTGWCGSQLWCWVISRIEQHLGRPIFAGRTLAHHNVSVIYQKAFFVSFFLAYWWNIYIFFLQGATPAQPAVGHSWPDFVNL